MKNKDKNIEFILPSGRKLIGIHFDSDTGFVGENNTEFLPLNKIMEEGENIKDLFKGFATWADDYAYEIACQNAEMYGSYDEDEEGAEQEISASWSFAFAGEGHYSYDNGSHGDMLSAQYTENRIKKLLADVKAIFDSSTPVDKSSVTQENAVIVWSEDHVTTISHREGVGITVDSFKPSVLDPVSRPLTLGQLLIVTQAADLYDEIYQLKKQRDALLGKLENEYKNYKVNIELSNDDSERHYDRYFDKVIVEEV